MFVRHQINLARPEHTELRGFSQENLIVCSLDIKLIWEDLKTLNYEGFFRKT